MTYVKVAYFHLSPETRTLVMDEEDCKVILSRMQVNIDPAQMEDLVSMIMEYDPEILDVLGKPESIDKTRVTHFTVMRGIG